MATQPLGAVPEIAVRSEPPSRDEREINLRWLVRLRWAAVIGQGVTIAVAHSGLHIAVPVVPLALLVAVEALSNLALTVWLKAEPHPPESVAIGIVAFDLLLFTTLLYFTGGPSNPFSFLYLIHLALAALMLRPAWTWALVALTLLCSGGLFLAHVPLPMGHEGHHAHHAGGSEFDVHLKGMWVALGVAASFIVYFLSRVRRELQDREADLARARERSAQSEQLAALGTLAAGAAHELASPLSTIAVAASELERSLTGSDSAIIDDVRLVRSQVARCRDVLSRLAADAGQTTGEAAEPIDVAQVIESALADIDGKERVKIEISAAARGERPELPLRSLAQALKSVVENALDAGQGEVAIRSDTEGGHLLLQVSDPGPGMTKEILRRAREPFFTTKPPGRGLGLGLFLAESIATQIGGKLRIESAPNSGTTVTLELPGSAR